MVRMDGGQEKGAERALSGRWIRPPGGAVPRYAPPGLPVPGYHELPYEQFPIPWYTFFRITFNFQLAVWFWEHKKSPDLQSIVDLSGSFCWARGFEGCPGGIIPAHSRKKSKSYGANLEKVAKTA